MTVRQIAYLLFVLPLLLCGCQHADTPSSAISPPSSPNERGRLANQQFLAQKTFDPWILQSAQPASDIPLYLGKGSIGYLIGPSGTPSQVYQAGRYKNGTLEALPFTNSVTVKQTPVSQRLDLRTGTPSGLPTGLDKGNQIDWPHLWQTSDIVINGDPEAQQVTHANLFYLLSSTYPGSDHSIPPMGLSSSVYGGHIFWDAEVWMLPALIVQHPDYAKSIIEYRFKLLTQARKNAKAHGYAGAEFPWESADTGVEVAPAEFAKERHITADVAYAAWQYSLWTGDKDYLRREGWPLLQATAQYWASRVTKGPDGKFHVKGVLSPDETAGVVDDDAYTNAVVQYNLRAATQAARLLSQTPDPQWKAIADRLSLSFDSKLGIPAEHDGMAATMQAKQADTLLLIHPLGLSFDPSTEGKMLDFYTAHTIKVGPAMTASIHAVVAAKLGRAQQSLDEFHDSYRPFMRAPWDAFSEKRTTDNIYFCTGMGGCLQVVLYGFAGLHVYSAGEHGLGTKLAGDADAALYADPHLPPGWGSLVIKGIRFRGRTLDLTVLPGNKVAIRSATL